jgi:hypothetical protein
MKQLTFKKYEGRFEEGINKLPNIYQLEDIVPWWMVYQ